MAFYIKTIKRFQDRKVIGLVRSKRDGKAMAFRTVEQARKWALKQIDKPYELEPGEFSRPQYDISIESLLPEELKSLIRKPIREGNNKNEI